MTELRTFPIDTKPQVGQMSEYFTQRLNGKQAGITVSGDSLGYYVFKSRGFTEATLNEPKPAMLIASSRGRDIVRTNPGLLKAIARGESIGDEIGQGQEGRVHKVILNTPNGQRAFALKYTFPIARDPMEGNQFQADYLFTPGVDQMRLMQLLDQDKPIPGLQLATPILATMDMTLAPFVEDGISANQVNELAELAEPRSDISALLISDTSKRMLQEIRIHDATTSLSMNFINRVNQELLFGGLFEVGEWLKNKLSTLPSDFLISPNISTAEAESYHNLLVSVQVLGEFFQYYLQHREVRKDYDEFRKRILQASTLIELTVSSKKQSSNTIIFGM